MPDHYDEEPVMEEPAPEPEPAPAPKKKREGKKMTDKQKADLNKHMEKLKKKGDMSASEIKSHRMKMMSRMRNKGMTVNKAHKDIMSS